MLFSDNRDEEYIPYTYLIGWSNLNIWYYGVQWEMFEKVNPKNLWKTYFTSSEVVKHFILLYGEPDIIQVRKTFQFAEDARKWESKVLKRMKTSLYVKWLNRYKFQDFIAFNEKRRSYIINNGKIERRIKNGVKIPNGFVVGKINDSMSKKNRRKRQENELLQTLKYNALLVKKAEVYFHETAAL